MENELNARFQHAVIGEGNTSTSSKPARGEVIFNTTLDNFRVGTDGNTAYSSLSDFLHVFTGANTLHPGTSGLVLAPSQKSSGDSDKFLCDDGSWKSVLMHPATAGIVTNGIRAMYFRPKNITNGNTTLQENYYIPIISSSAIGSPQKISVLFEIIGREDGLTYYGKYYFNSMNAGAGPSETTYADFVCLGFYTNSNKFTSPEDVIATMGNAGSMCIFKKEYSTTAEPHRRNPKDGMFVVNVLSENTSSYSVQTYYTTQSSDDSSVRTLTFSDGISFSNWDTSQYMLTIPPESMCSWTTYQP